jgi:FKBP-type peptidyl-prolyl cis-trans isomerase FklB
LKHEQGKKSEKMKQFLTLTLVAGLGMGAAMAQKAIPLKTAKDSLGYAVGANIGNDFKRQGIQLNLETLMQGLKDAMGGKPMTLNEQQVREVLTAFQTSQQAKAGEAKKAKAEANLKRGEDFLAQNKTKQGVQVLPNGLQYQVLSEGTGKSPSATDRVTTHYQGTLIDGTEFDSSYKRGEPATFPVNGVIQAWQIILPMMKEGGKMRIWSPANLAYGASGQGPTIGPNEVLIFDIELIKVN